MYYKRKVGLLVALVIGLAIIITGYWGGRSTASKIQQAKWPPVSITFKVWGKDIGPGQAPGYAIFKLEYNGTKDWRIETVEYPGNKAEGSWTQYDGKLLRSYDAAFNKVTEAEAPRDGPIVPMEWLVPRNIDYLVVQQGWTKVINPNGDIILTKQEMIRDENGNIKARITEKTFDRDTGIPIKVIEHFDGELVREVTVESLVVK